MGGRRWTSKVLPPHYTASVSMANLTLSDYGLCDANVIVELACATLACCVRARSIFIWIRAATWLKLWQRLVAWSYHHFLLGGEAGLRQCLFFF